MTVIEKLDMNVKQANSDFVAIKNKIVEKGVEVADGTRTADYADKVGEVYEKGKQEWYDIFTDDTKDNYGILYGAYLLKEKPSYQSAHGSGGTELNVADLGIYTLFYDGNSYLYDRVATFSYDNERFWMSNDAGQDKIAFEYNHERWFYAVDREFPSDSYRLIVFTKPMDLRDEFAHPMFDMFMDELFDKSELTITEASRRMEYDKFWDGVLAEVKENGFGPQLFGGRGWNDDTFNPPEKIDYITNAYGLFAYSGFISKEKISMVDFSSITSLCSSMFGYSNIEHIPRIDMRGTSSVEAVFMNATLVHTIDCLVLRDDGSQTLANTFVNCVALENLTIEGTIGQSINLGWSTKLSKKSITSVINALSTTTSGLSITLSRTAKEAAFPDTDGVPNKAWINLINTKTNWTINLI